MSINNLKKVEKDRCVFLIVDMQNDFIAEGAPIECPGGKDIVPNIKRFKKWAKENGIPVIYTQEAHRPEKVDFGLELERNEPEHCVEGTKGYEIIDELKPEEGDFVVQKRRYSAFYQTDFEFLLKGLKRDSLIIAGAATNVCVYASAMDGQQRDMQVVVLSDCCAGTSPDLHDAFLKNIDWVMGDVADAETVMNTLK